MLLEHINDGIIRSDLSIDEFLPNIDCDEETIRDVYRLLLLSYGHMRGKDYTVYAKHKNALAKGNLTVAHRSRIAAISINQKLCAFKKEKGHCKDVKDNTNHDGSENENDTLIISPLEGIETMIEEAVLIADVEFDCDLEEEEEIKDD
eukprot:CAMPEP_0202480488 /NCGR_PEP_ID=MMETSP1361-20130828/464_1 /ASSEMBLY_ACC=CAM_ASM_000849 /TAXON_ID=210615 /ORGANISM="Staurosira complex sp., Strain CCMP2646" /LENGTH=147 /DNA_ID=CAMNT_0049107929 /DNA_START=480 /DNA_END=921 /DNA_ORIENTATION=-